MATDQQTHGSQARLVIDRVTASRLGITPQAIDNALYDAFGQRQISTLFTQLNQYHVILETLPDFQRNPSKLNDIYVLSTSGSAVPLSAFTHFESGTAPLAINHQGQFPAVTISFNLAPGAALGEATKAIEHAQKELGMPLSVQASFQGTAQAFIASLANEPLLILAAIVTVYHHSRRALRKLHPSHHDSFDAAVGGRRRDSRAADLPARNSAWSRSSASSC